MTKINIGDKFNFWEVIDKTESKSRFICKCTGCNNTTRSVLRTLLISGRSKSCGCKVTELIKQTNQQKYNCDFPQQNETIREKTIQTLQQKYNVDNFTKTDLYHKKRKATCVEKYQAEHHSKSQKWKNRNKPKYGGVVLGKAKLGE
jgi:hypothetical protein